MADLRPDSLFNISELNFELTEPQLLLCNNFPAANYEINYTGLGFNIEVFGRKVYLLNDDENLQKIRHELVSGVLDFTSDTPLSSIGYKGEEGKLTPDYINHEKKQVVEVTTRAVPELYSVKNAYQEKLVRYSYLVTPKGYELFPLVVSSTSIYTNTILSDDVVTALCLRARIGLALEHYITDQLGKDIFSEDLSQSEQMVSDVFRGLTILPESEEHFDMSIITSCAEDPTSEDYKHTGAVLGTALNEAKSRSIESDLTLQNYLSDFKDEECKTSKKRICNIPMILMHDINHDSERANNDLDPNNCEMPGFLHRIWNASLKVEPERLTLDKALKEALSEEEYSKHRLQKSIAFNVKLTDDEKIEAAKTGLWAKSIKDDPELLDKESEDHKSFHPTKTNTEDIELFVKKSLLDSYPRSSLPKVIGSIIEHTKSLWSKNEKSLSFKLLSAICRTKIGLFSQTITKLMTEIAYAYKYWIKRSDFYHKEIDGVHMLIRTTSSHIFVIYAFPKSNSEIIDTGRLGPKIYESSNYYFTDVCSYNEPTLEHFIKCSPYITSIIAHLVSNFELDLDNLVLTDKRISESINSIILLYLNNKTDVEELITNQRYLTMSLLEELDPNPYRFTDRLPTVLRSRLTSYFLKRTIRLMHHYSSSRIMKIPTTHSGDVFADYRGILSIMGDFELTIKQKINEFYFGYVISKERGRGSDRNFKIMKKIVQEEYRFRDTIKSVFSKTLTPQIHQSDPNVIRVFCKIFRNYMIRMLGPKSETVIKQEIIKHLSRTTFSELATLKVASRSYEDHIIVPLIPDNATTKDVVKSLEKANPEEIKKRPRVMEALSTLIEDFKTWKGYEPKHPVQLLPFCIKLLESKGYFDSDIFPKPQHGGDREIHVLEISMRIFQFHVEQISKVMCRLTPSDTLTHSNEKESFVKKHYSKSVNNLGDTFVTLGKSADATKWCQRHHSSKFAAVLVGIIPKMFWPLITRLMKIWQHKRITFPIQFAGNFLVNKDTKSNEIYERMRKEFFSGTGIFPIAKNNKIMIKSGMMQGILHYTSSITHGVIQVVMSEIQSTYLTKRGYKSEISIVQGSDDSAEILSIEGSVTKKKLQLMTTMLHWKECVGKWFSIYTSRAKSAIGTLDFVEYNSEWYLKGSVIKPTFRWVSACMELTVTERFIDRLRTTYGTLTQVLEGGGKVLECSVIQMCQAWLHYMMIGLHNNILAHKTAGLIFKLKDPALGFFPLDSDFNCSLTGVDFQLYHLFSETNYGIGLKHSMINDPSFTEQKDEVKDVAIGKDLRSVRIKFGNLRLWYNMIRRMNIPDLISIVEEVENNPYLVFANHYNWDMAKYSIYLKVFQPGVKESISGYSPTIRMMAASAYMINRPCISILPEEYDENKPMASQIRKLSLFHALISKKQEQKSKVKNNIENVFPFHSEYLEVMDYIKDLENRHLFQKVSLKNKSKQKIMVFEKFSDEISVSDLCKSKWLGIGKLPLSRRQIETFWETTKLKYNFLKDSLIETKNYLGMSTVELKNYLESLDSKPRYVTLLDSSARGGSLNSAITRIFWSNTKILLPSNTDEEETSYSLRSKLFSILTCWLTNIKKRDEISKILKNSELLSQRKVPIKVQKLKIFRDWLHNVPNDVLLRNINNLKLGSIGYFTKIQSGFGRNRKGLGIWIGHCLGVNTRVEMIGNQCKTITLSGLQDVNLNNLGSTLKDLIEGFSLEPMKRECDSMYWLTESGKIIGGKGRSESIPIMLDPDLDISIVDKVSEYRWFWTVDDVKSKIRLIAQVSPDLKITVLSEDFSSKDWDPIYPIETDKTLKSWSEGSQMNINMIEEQLNSSYRMEVKDILRVIKRMDESPTNDGWDISKLVSTINYMICDNNILSGPKILNDEVKDEDVDKMMMMMNTADLSSLTENWADIMEEEEEELDKRDLFDAIEFDEDFEAQLDLFSRNYDESDSYFHDKWKMPKTNNCFEPINLLSRLQFNGLPFKDVVSLFKEKTQMTTTGLLSNMLSLFTKRICFPVRLSEDDQRLAKLQTDVISVTTSLRSDRDLETLDLQKLDANIKYLKSQIEYAPDETREILSNQLKKYERIRALKTSTPTKVEFLENYQTFDIISKLRLKIMETNQYPESFEALDDNIFCVIVKNDLDYHVDKMTEIGDLTPHEQSLYREAIGKPFATSLLLDAITFKFKFGLSLAGYVTNSSLSTVIFDLL